MVAARERRGEGVQRLLISFKAVHLHLTINTLATEMQSNWIFSMTWWLLIPAMALGALARATWFGLQLGWIWADDLVVRYAERHGDSVRTP